MFDITLRRFLAGLGFALAQSALAAAPPLAACDAGFQAVLQPVPAASSAMDASALWLDRRLLRWPGAPAAGRYRLHHAANGAIEALPGRRVAGADGAIPLKAWPGALPPALQQGPQAGLAGRPPRGYEQSNQVTFAHAARFKWVAAGAQLAVPQRDLPKLAALHRGQLVLVREDAGGRVLEATAVQAAGALDDLYAPAAEITDLGAVVTPRGTSFKLWAPTARAVWVCLYADGQRAARQMLRMRRDDRTGAWSSALPRDLSGTYYTYLVDVFVRGTGRVRNRATDPYSLSLTTDSRRSWVGNLDDAALKPTGWPATPPSGRVKAATDLVIYELHVRDFSAGDDSVSAAHRGKYLAFTETASRGMRHLKALADAGVTDVHLLPVFDFATVPEQGCTTPTLHGGPASETQQAAAMAAAATDCFNWGYDPWHYTAPEGSYATDAADGATRVLEFRRMVAALHTMGLRVGMDMVYNHTSAAGQAERSVLDRIVPGYYQRLNAVGGVETSTCCANTATEHRMMGKLMVDSAVVWVRAYGIDSLRFDLMGHQPRAVMEQLQRAVNQASGRRIHLIGEGWDFGEVAGGARFVQAAQASLAGSGIASFSDRARDAARGGGCCDNVAQTLERQGWLNGLHDDPNAHALGRTHRADLLRAADMLRVGLAGTLRDYRLHTHDGSVKALSSIDYAGQGAGYAAQPGEVVNYVENHDNPTLFDINVLKLPAATLREDRARIQVLGMALTAFSQGLAYYHAGIEALRSKSGDRNSFDSGDGFNRLDWSFSDNHWGNGLPPAADNAAFWPALRPLLADPAIKPTAHEIGFARDAFLDLLRIRASTSLLRLQSADEVARRLTFHNTGPDQQPTVLVGHLDGRGLPGAGFGELLYAIHAGKEAATLVLPALKGHALRLHPVHLAANAADKRPATQAHWDAASGTLRVPPRTALVYVSGP